TAGAYLVSGRRPSCECQASRGRGTVFGRGSQCDGEMQPGCLSLSAKDEGQRGCGKEPDHEGSHDQRRRTAQRNRAAQKPTRWNEGHCDVPLKWTFESHI